MAIDNPGWVSQPNGHADINIDAIEYCVTHRQEKAVFWWKRGDGQPGISLRFDGKRLTDSEWFSSLSMAYKDIRKTLYGGCNGEA
jgi:hypothetical protein